MDFLKIFQKFQNSKFRNFFIFYIIYWEIHTYIYKENNPFKLFWTDYFFSQMPSIFNTNNTCNKYIRIKLNIKINVTNTIFFVFFSLSFKKCNKIDEYIYTYFFIIPIIPLNNFLYNKIVVCVIKKRI